ncbi:MAG: type II toxin-antitoxin system HicB family antitoxin [Parcubacteria group bacterium]|nr:type II toxin-antitoxin system HicB family antitoxin [Parcubacteria group bacterium]
MTNKTYHYNIVFRPEPEGGYTVIVPSLSGCVTYGKTLKEAKRMAVDAIHAYLSSLKKHKEPIPNDAETLLASIEYRHVKAS